MTGSDPVQQMRYLEPQKALEIKDTAAASASNPMPKADCQLRRLHHLFSNRFHQCVMKRHGYVQNQSLHLDVLGVIALQAKYRLQFMEEEIKKAEEQLVILAWIQLIVGSRIV